MSILHVRPTRNLLRVATTAVAILAGAVAVASPLQSQWASSGQNNHNTRYGATERILSADNVGRLKPRWTFTTAGDISAVATVVSGIAYVPDWGGTLWAIDIQTGKAYCPETEPELVGYAAAR